jgi:hypothetical protein
VPTISPFASTCPRAASTDLFAIALRQATEHCVKRLCLKVDALRLRHYALFGNVGNGINPVIEALRKRQDRIAFIGVCLRPPSATYLAKLA